jgi:hypothetical protein
MIAGIAAFALKLLTGGMLDKVLGHLKDRGDTQTERERIQAEVVKETVRAEIEGRKVSGETIIGMRGDWVPRAIVAPFVVHLWLVATDTILTGFGYGHLFEVPSFPAPFDTNGWQILLSYFGLASARVLATGAVTAFRRPVK